MGVSHIWYIGIHIGETPIHTKMINKNVLKDSKWLFNIYLHRTLKNPKSLSLRSVKSGTVRSVTTALGEFVETTLSCLSLTHYYHFIPPFHTRHCASDTAWSPPPTHLVPPDCATMGRTVPLKKLTST